MCQETSIILFANTHTPTHTSNKQALSDKIKNKRERLRHERERLVRDGPGRCIREDPGVRGSDGDRIPQQKSASVTQQCVHYTKVALTQVTDPEGNSTFTVAF